MKKKQSTFDIQDLCVASGYIEDSAVSFNIDRPDVTVSEFPRQIVTTYFLALRQAIIPGIVTSRERQLSRVLKEKQNWREVKKHSFGYGKGLFSFLWRFYRDSGINDLLVDNLVPLDPEDSKKVRRALKKYISYLESKLQKGMVFLVPDTEITFRTPSRLPKTYSRPVLLYDVRGTQLIIIPFTTKVERINPRTDILFDQSYKGMELDSKGTPSVENFPYKIFSRKTALVVSAFDSVTREQFLSSVLVHVGPVRSELIELVKDKMKILAR